MSLSPDQVKSTTTEQWNSMLGMEWVFVVVAHWAPVSQCAAGLEEGLVLTI